MSLNDLTLKEFSDRLNSKEPVPGGGGAAALTGALAASLAGMVGHLTAGKKKYAAYEEDIQRILKEVTGIEAELLSLIDEDADNFLPLSRAYSLPKDTPEEKQHREETLRACCLEALKAPEKMMFLCHKLAPLLEEVTEKGSVLAISDAGCSAALLDGAYRAAWLNVAVNLKSLKDDTFSTEIRKVLLPVMEEDLERCRKVYETVFNKL